MLVVAEHHRRVFEPTVLFDIDLIESIDQDVRNVWVGEQLFERSEAEQLVEHVVNKILALVQTERRRLGFTFENRDDDVAQLRLRLLTLRPRQAFEVESVEEFLMDAALEFLIVLTAYVELCRRWALERGHGLTTSLRKQRQLRRPARREKIPDDAASSVSSRPTSARSPANFLNESARPL